MPRLVWSPSALADVTRLHAFLFHESPEAAQKAVKVIRGGVKELSRYPRIGRLVEGMLPEFREWIIPFGHGAYVARYHFDGEQVAILAVRHGREAGR